MAKSARGQLEALGIEPRKSLGQNFLADDQTAADIVAAVGAESGDVVIEIGPGTGALTRPLLKRAGHVIAIELDPRLVSALQDTFSGMPNLTIVHADALAANFGELIATHAPTQTAARFAGNLPYYITSSAIRRMLESGLAWRSIVVTVQLEVAQRMVAGPGDMSLLSLSTQLYGVPETVMKLGPGAFYPEPGVDSAVVRILPHPKPLFERPDVIFKLARPAFGQRRKQLINTLSIGTGFSKIDSAELLLKARVDPSRRPETLRVDEWVRLAGLYETFTPSDALTATLDNL